MSYNKVWKEWPSIDEYENIMNEVRGNKKTQIMSIHQSNTFNINWEDHSSLAIY